MTVRHNGKRRGDRSGRRPGFTLLEVVVAVAVGGIAVSAAVALLMGLNGQAEAIQATAAVVSGEANAERLLRELVRNVDLGAGESLPLRGDGNQVRFESWCQSPVEVTELCSVRLFFGGSGAQRTFAAEISIRRRLESAGRTRPVVVTLRQGFGEGTLLYLADAGSGGRWVSAWEQRVLPAALGLAMDGDTLILRVR